MDLHQKLFLYFSALALLAQSKPKQGEPGWVHPWEELPETRHPSLISESKPEKSDPILNKHAMEAMHKKMDIDGDGKVSVKEVIEFHEMTVHDMAVNGTRHHEEVVHDTNKDGKVSLEEIMKFMNFMESQDGSDTSRLSDDAKKVREEKKKRGEQNAKEKFEAADTNKDGQLDKNELLYFDFPQRRPDVLKALVKARVKRKDQDGDSKLDSKEYFADEDMKGYGNEEEIKKAFSKMDVDGDGKLSEEELYQHEIFVPKCAKIFEALLADADTDKDSLLSLDEFHKHMPLIAEHEAADYIKDWMLIHRIKAPRDSDMELYSDMEL